VETHTRFSRPKTYLKLMKENRKKSRKGKSQKEKKEKRKKEDSKE
jgi:hypothetical protein